MLLLSYCKPDHPEAQRLKAAIYQVTPPFALEEFTSLTVFFRCLRNVNRLPVAAVLLLSSEEELKALQSQSDLLRGVRFIIIAPEWGKGRWTQMIALNPTFCWQDNSDYSCVEEVLQKIFQVQVYG